MFFICGLARSGSEWLGIAWSGVFEMVFGFLSGLFLGKWVGVGSMNGEFEDLSIGNKF